MMTQAWRLFGKCEAASKEAGMKLEEFESCLVPICEDKAIINKDTGLSYNYGVCAIAHNLYGILKNIATAIGNGDSMVIQKVDSEWSEGPFKFPVKVFNSMKEDLFEGRGSKEKENENIS